MSLSLKIFLCCLAGAAGLFLLGVLLRSHRAIRYLFLTAISGVAALYAVNAIGILTQIKLAVNGFTLGISASCGAPGVVALLISDVFLKK